jgi:DNA-binding transcriptional LysR family regulator
VAGTIRITATDVAIDTVLLPRLSRVLRQHPDLRVELSADYRLVDVVAERYDIGVRYGDQVQKDMVAVRLTTSEQMAIVAAPGYFDTHKVPVTVQDLARHNCINLRLASGGTYAWELLQDGRPVEARVTGQVTCNGAYQLLNAALAGHGLAFLPVHLVQPYLDAGRLRRVMDDCCPAFPGLHAYYPSARNSSRALRVVIDAIRQH